MGSISFADNHVGSIYFAVCCALQVLAIFAVILRLWSRRLQKASLQLNDYEILIAVVRGTLPSEGCTDARYRRCRLATWSS